VLAGKCEEGYRRKVEERIGRLGMESRVRLLGERRDVADLLRAADCFCLPSRHEILPIALLETMAAGVPVVATDVGGVSELVRDGLDGFVTRSGDAAALAAALSALAGDSELRGQMGDNGRKRVRSSFTPEACVPRIVESYQLARRRRKKA
jgi:glycosyltransferase involved in cell wall biosynthesis